MNNAPPAPSEITEWVFSYLSQFPHAADTAEGIQRWWLAPRYGEVPLAAVKQALAELERTRIVQNLHPFAAQPTYGRGPLFDQNSA